jgi:hypothetical protein
MTVVATKMHRLNVCLGQKVMSSPGSRALREYGPGLLHSHAGIGGLLLRRLPAGCAS